MMGAFNAAAAGTGGTGRLVLRLCRWAGIFGPHLVLLVLLIDGWLPPGSSARTDVVRSLDLGPTGWMQRLNLVLTGLLLILCAAGALHGMRRRGASGWLDVTTLLIALSGVGVIVAGLLLPAAPGTPQTTVRWILHTVVVGLVLFSLGLAGVLVGGKCLSTPGWRFHGVSTLLPDVVLLDLLPRMNGVTAEREMKWLTPSTQVIILTSYSEDEPVCGAIKAGTRSSLLTAVGPEELVEAVHAAARGQACSIPRSPRGLREMQQRSPLAELTAREREVLTLLARGCSNAQIAADLVIGEGTVKTHVSHILTKLHLADRTQAAIYALQQHLVPLEDALEPGESWNEHRIPGAPGSAASEERSRTSMTRP